MALKRIWLPSPNYSSRGGSGVRLVIIHTAEGATTYEALGNFFASGSAGVSSHVGIDDKAGKIGEYVKPPNKAWTAGDANPISVNAELCGFAAWGPKDWEKHPNMLDNTARWIAEECKRYNIPIKKLSASQAVSGWGVCGHVDVSGPGGHWDPGPDFPWDRVISAAKTGGAVYGPPPPPPWKPLARPAIYDTIGADMPADYILKDTSDGFPGSGNFYACFPSGVVRRVSESERTAMKAGQTGGPPIKQADFSKESSNIYLQLDQAMRGFIAERK